VAARPAGVTRRAGHAARHHLAQLIRIPLGGISGVQNTRRTTMLRLCYGLFVIGLACYVAALFFIGSDTGETLSDIGNGVLLTTIAILLLRMSDRRTEGASS
jgi:hypothetical protein